MIVCGIDRRPAEVSRYLGPRRRPATQSRVALDEGEHLGLSCGKVFHRGPVILKTRRHTQSTARHHSGERVGMILCLFIVTLEASLSRQVRMQSMPQVGSMCFGCCRTLEVVRRMRCRTCATYFPYRRCICCIAGWQLRHCCIATQATQAPCASFWLACSLVRLRRNEAQFLKSGDLLAKALDLPLSHVVCSEECIAKAFKPFAAHTQCCHWR